MARIPTDASLETQLAIRDLNDEIRSLKAEISRLSTSASKVDTEELNDAIAKAAQSSGPLDINDTFRGSGGAHSFGLVPDPGADVPTYEPQNRFLHESGKWLPPVASSFTIGNDPTLKHNILGHLNVTGGIYCSKLTTGNLISFGSPACIMRPSVDFTHNSNNNFLKIPLNTSVEDTRNMADVTNNRIVCKLAGIYRIWGALTWDINATGIRTLAVYLNGAVTRPFDRRIALTGVTTGNNWSFDCRLAVDDYVELWGHQSSGGSLTVFGEATGHNMTVFGVEWVRP